MDDKTQMELLKELFDMHCKLYDRFTVLSARSTIDHWIAMRLVSTSNLLGELDDESRTLLAGTLEAARVLTVESKDTKGLNAYMALIRERVEELSGRPLPMVSGIKRGRRTRH